MARNGFESNDDYEYRVRCLLSYPASGLRTLAVEGESGRRKTAFANALANALGWDHVLYHDFTATGPRLGQLEVPDVPDAEGESAVPLTTFDRTLSEACAFSEAASTILIVDQLQAADFADHLRLHRFVTTGEWTYPLATLRANQRRFLLMLISEGPLFHSLQKECFRIWTDPEHAPTPLEPSRFGLDDDARPVLIALASVFDVLGIWPTPTAIERIVHDVVHHARTARQLRQSLYGWTEGLGWAALNAPDLVEPLNAVEQAIADFLGHDEIELGGDH